jgi:hypothetical protein
MEIQRTPVTLEQRMEYLNQAGTNVEVNKKSFPWMAVIISGLVGASICAGIIYLKRKRKERIRTITNLSYLPMP